MKRTFMASNFIASNTKIEKINLLSLHFLYPYYFLIHFVPKRSTNSMFLDLTSIPYHKLTSWEFLFINMSVWVSLCAPRLIPRALKLTTM